MKKSEKINQVEKLELRFLCFHLSCINPGKKSLFIIMLVLIFLSLVIFIWEILWAGGIILVRKGLELFHLILPTRNSHYLVLKQIKFFYAMLKNFSYIVAATWFCWICLLDTEFIRVFLLGFHFITNHTDLVFKNTFYKWCDHNTFIYWNGPGMWQFSNLNS